LLRIGAPAEQTVRVDRQKLSMIAHTAHPLAAPVSEANAVRLLRRAACPPDARLLDFGCGEGAWLLAALESYPRASAVGIDLSAPALERARRAAEKRGVSDRLALREVDAKRFPADPFHDLVLCVGSTHAFGGLVPTLDFLRGHVRSGGIALVGEGFWARPPDDAALSGLSAAADDYTDLAGLVETVESAGWNPIFAHVSDDSEWDDYEWSWVGSLTQWALDNPSHPDAREAMAAAREHRAGWLGGYRGTLGFACLLLRPARSR
jgi:SAM-dependent methyltransferase